MGDTRWTDDQQRVIDARNCNLLVSAEGDFDRFGQDCGVS